MNEVSSRSETEKTSDVACIAQAADEVSEKVRRPSVLIPHQCGGNIYVQELGRAYLNLGCGVVFGPDNLLQRNIKPDLVHLNWPEELYRWRGEGTLQERVDAFKAAVDGLATLGVPLALTVHNLAPHDHFDNPIDRDVYQFVIDRVAVVHHHCPQSPGWLGELYAPPAGQRVVVVPHGHYRAYPNTIDKVQARKLLDLPQDATVFLHFGQIRGYKGLNLLLDAFDLLRDRSVYLVIAGQYSSPSGMAGFVERLRIAYLKYSSKNIRIHGRSIPSSEVQRYLNAADAVVMSHKAGLNSGVAVLGMTFGKVVIGPDIGCISAVLGAGRNVIYQSGSARALADAMMTCASSKTLSHDGKVNASVAGTWHWDSIAQSIIGACVLGHDSA